jgi:hypothetical protein
MSYNCDESIYYLLDSFGNDELMRVEHEIPHVMHPQANELTQRAY